MARQTGRFKNLAVILWGVGCISIAQFIQMLFQEKINGIKGLYGVGNIVSSVVYIGIVYGLLRLICHKILHLSMQECRIGKPQIKRKWLISGLILPIGVSAIALLFPGKLVSHSMNGSAYFFILTKQIALCGLGAGIVEEMIFRGVMMKAIEKQSGKKAAILIPSIVFAAGHIAGSITHFGTVLLLMIAGISVGCMFSLVAYESGSIWNSVVIHGLWNIMMTGGIINIGTSYNNEAIFSYVLDPKYSFLLGGQGSIEASVIAIVGYLIIALIAWRSIKKRHL